MLLEVHSQSVGEGGSHPGERFDLTGLPACDRGPCNTQTPGKFFLGQSLLQGLPTAGLQREWDIGGAIERPKA
jgi:hypothetical protein